MKKISIVNGRLIDPTNDIDQLLDIHIKNQQIIAIGEAPDGFVPEEIIDASDNIVCPGFIDLYGYPTLPGKKTFAQELYAATKGGITSSCCPPDIEPVLDNPITVEWLQQKTQTFNLAQVLPLGGLTKNLVGVQLNEIALLKETGCVAMNNGRQDITDTGALRHCFEYAANHDILLLLNASDASLSKGYLHEGEVSFRLGLTGIPASAETIAVARNILLAEEVGARLHIGQVSCHGSLELIRQAKQRGVAVTADVGIAHLQLNEIDCDDFNTLCHVQPPLRREQDRLALQQALADKTLDAICSNHQPQTQASKRQPFAESSVGISSFETLLPLTLRLIENKTLSLKQAIACLTTNPAKILQIDKGHLSIGASADICIFSPTASWQLNEAIWASQGQNTPFWGWEMIGQVQHTLIAGEIVYSLNQ